MFDLLYFWNLIWSFFMLLSLVFIPVFIVMIYFTTRQPRTHHGSTPSSAGPGSAMPGGVGENPTKRAA